MPPFILLPIRVGATRLATYLTLSIPRRFYIGQPIPFVCSFLDVERPCQLIELQQRRAKSSCSLSFFKTANLCVYIYIYPFSSTSLSFSNVGRDSFFRRILVQLFISLGTNKFIDHDFYFRKSKNNLSRWFRGRWPLSQPRLKPKSGKLSKQGLGGGRRRPRNTAPGSWPRTSGCNSSADALTRISGNSTTAKRHLALKSVKALLL